MRDDDQHVLPDQKFRTPSRDHQSVSPQANKPAYAYSVDSPLPPLPPSREVLAPPSTPSSRRSRGDAVDEWSREYVHAISMPSPRFLRRDWPSTAPGPPGREHSIPYAARRRGPFCAAARRAAGVAAASSACRPRADRVALRASVCGALRVQGHATRRRVQSVMQQAGQGSSPLGVAHGHYACGYAARAGT